MSQSHRSVALRVVGAVALGDGKYLPHGDYQGTIVTNHIFLHGTRKDQIAKISIYLTEEQIASFLGKEPNSNRYGIDCDFTADFIKGAILEII